LSEPTLESAAALVGRALHPLADALEADDAAVVGFIEQLGWTLPSVPPALRELGDAAGSVAEGVATLEVLRGDRDESGEVEEQLLATLAALLLDLGVLLSGLRALPDRLRAELPGDYITRTGIDQAFLPRLYAYTLTGLLDDATPLGYRLLWALGAVDEIAEPEDPARDQPAYVRYVIAPERLGDALSDVGGLFADRYGWGAAQLEVDRITEMLLELSPFVVDQALVDTPSAELVAAVAPGVTLPAEEGPGSLIRVPLLRTENVSLELGVYPVPTAGPDQLQGLALTLRAGGDVSVVIPLGPGLSLTVAADVDLEPGVAVVVSPDRPPRIVGEALTGGAPVTVDGAVGVRIARTGEEGEHARLATMPGGTTVEATELYLGAGTEFSTRGRVDPYLEAGIVGGRVQIGTAEADGFLARILPPEGIGADFEVGILWSAVDGVRLTGSGDLRAVLPVQQQIGPLRLDSVSVELAVDTQGIRAALGATGGVVLGPLTATVDGVGAQGVVRFAEGNLGPLDAAFAFKPPTGAALSVDAGAVTGGGFLFFDPAREQYAGGLHLEFGAITLNAIGLLTTRLPNGRRGFSLLVIIQASGFAPIQLGFGFTLNGVGGLLGVNRTVALDVLRAGVRDRSLDAILFSPDDPTPRAPQIISTLQAVFPPAQDRYVFGPMALIGWGTPTILTIEIALILELPSPLRLAVLGRLKAALPRPEQAIVRLQLDAVGIVDFDRREASVDATLFDSFVGPFALTGDMAARVSWGEQPQFALSLGGFHPAFTPPPGFPALRRLALTLSTSDNPRLRLEAYLALTSNTIQLGSRLDFAASALGFTLEGVFSFDALVQLSPFRFLVDILARLALKRGRSTLMSLDVVVHLAGPAPWDARGEVTFKILFFKATISFHATFGQAAAAPPAVREPVWPQLRAAFVDGRNWRAELPPAESRLAAFRDVPAAAGEIVVHPLGLVSVSQRVAPLERDLSRFGTAPPADHRRFELRGADGLEVKGRTYDHFPPAQFTEMSDAEKLSAPSYERMVSGARIGPSGDAVAVGVVQETPLAYETVVITDPARPQRDDAPYEPGAEAVAALTEIGPAALAATRDSGRERFAVDGTAPSAVEPEYVLATRDDLEVVELPELDGTYAAAREALAARADAGELQIVRRHETEAVLA
jgi:hypothetical protein